MKVLFRTVAVLLGFIATTTLNAQSKRDVTYSIHNYKHPNKAAEMKRIADARPTVYVEEIVPETARPEDNLSAGTSRNYKAINPSDARIRVFRVTEAPSVIYRIVPRSANYKQQFPATDKNGSGYKPQNPAEKQDLVL